MFIQENPKSGEKPNYNEISLSLANTLANPAKWALTAHLQALHYNEVLPAFYKLHYIEYHEKNTMGAQYHVPQNHHYLTSSALTLSRVKFT